jgi:hypothetical protein
MLFFTIYFNFYHSLFVLKLNGIAYFGLEDLFLEVPCLSKPENNKKVPSSGLISTFISGNLTGKSLLFKYSMPEKAVSQNDCVNLFFPLLQF